MKRKSISMFWFRAIATEIVAAGGIMALLGNNHASLPSSSDVLAIRPTLNRSLLEDSPFESRALHDLATAEQPSFAATPWSTWSPIGNSQAALPSLAPSLSPTHLAWTNNPSQEVSTLSPSAWHGHNVGPRLSPAYDRSRR